MDLQIIQNYTEFLQDKGYSAQTIHAYSKALEHAPDTWNTSVPKELYEHINCSLQSKQELFLPSARHNIKPASSQLFLMVTGMPFKDYGKQTAFQESEYADILSEFFSYSVKFKHMTELSAQAERQHISKFLNSLKGVTDTWSEITAKDIRDYICTEFQNLKTSSMGRYVTSLRNFFRFLEYKGNTINQSILALPLAPAVWGKSKTPAVLSADEDMRLRRHYPDDNEQGIRNNIIIRLMLEDYVLNYRPRVTDNHLLLRKVLNNQYISMTRECVRGVIRRAYEKEKSKVGYTCKSKTVEKQILKDIELIKRRKIDESHWHFYRSPTTGKIGMSKPLQKFLDECCKKYNGKIHYTIEYKE